MEIIDINNPAYQITEKLPALWNTFFVSLYSAIWSIDQHLQAGPWWPIHILTTLLGAHPKGLFEFPKGVAMFLRQKLSPAAPQKVPIETSFHSYLRCLSSPNFCQDLRGSISIVFVSFVKFAIVIVSWISKLRILESDYTRKKLLKVQENV